MQLKQQRKQWKFFVEIFFRFQSWFLWKLSNWPREKVKKTSQTIYFIMQSTSDPSIAMIHGYIQKIYSRVQIPCRHFNTMSSYLFEMLEHGALIEAILCSIIIALYIFYYKHWLRISQNPLSIYSYTILFHTLVALLILFSSSHHLSLSLLFFFSASAIHSLQMWSGKFHYNHKLRGYSAITNCIFSHCK